MSYLSDLTPMEVNLKPNTPLPKVRASMPLSPEQMVFLQKHLNIMVEKKLLKKVKNPKTGCAVFLVPKKGPKKWRMVADMVCLNRCCTKTPLIMPLLEQMLSNLGKSTWDLLSGFNLMRVNTDLFVIVTPFGCFQMESAPMGFLNTPQVFQERITSEVLEPAGLLCVPDDGAGNWVDDTLVYGSSVENFL